MTAVLRRLLDFWIGVPVISVLSLGNRRRRKRQGLLRRILVIKLAAFGDTVLLIPTLRALREALPSARIDWLVSPVNQALARMVPYVDETILLSSFRPASLWDLIRTLRGTRYDLVIDFEQWSRGTALLAWITGAPELLGFKTPGQHRDGLFTQTWPKRFDRHERDDFFELASSRVFLSGRRDLELWENTQGMLDLQTHVPSLGHAPSRERCILLHPGCGRDGTPREWPLDKYAQLGLWLQHRFPARLYISGGPDEKDKAGRLASAIPESVNVSARLSWAGMIALVKRMNLVISGNTGVMHVAAAWGIPQVALHGPTDANLWGPLNHSARVLKSPCPECPTLKLGFEYHRRDSSCMDRISLEAVCQTCASLLAP
jgi:ADP-heptose:LPS heptosyltransferase